jgi:hypothetical protein
MYKYIPKKESLGQVILKNGINGMELNLKKYIGFNSCFGMMEI